MKRVVVVPASNSTNPTSLNVASPAVDLPMSASGDADSIWEPWATNDIFVEGNFVHGISQSLLDGARNAVMHVISTTVMHQHAIFTDVEVMFSVDFDVVNRLAGFSAGERFKFPSRVIREPQVFADSQVSCCDELLSVFASERMRGGCADDVR